MQASALDGLLPPDERLSAFLSLLRAHSSSSAHLGLLDDNTLYGSLAFYLSSLAEPEHVGRLAHAVANSGAFWASPPPREGAARAAASADPPPLLVARAHNLARAVAQATTRRLDLLLRTHSGAIGWRTQRAFAHWAETIAQSAQPDSLLAAATGGVSDSSSSDAAGDTLFRAWAAAGADPALAGLYGTPLPRLAILTGLLLGLHAIREERARGVRPARGVKLGRLARSIETAWLATLSHSIEMIQICLSPASDESEAESESVLNGGSAPHPGPGPGPEASAVPLAPPLLITTSNPSSPESDPGLQDAWEKEFVRRQMLLEPSPYPSTWDLRARRTVWEPTILLAGQVGQYLHEKQVRAFLPAQAFVQVASDALLGLYEQHSVPACLRELSPGSLSRIETLQQDRLYPWIGPLSRLASFALGQSVLDLTPGEAQDLLLGTSGGPSDSGDEPIGSSNSEGTLIPPLLSRIEALSAEVAYMRRISPLWARRDSTPDDAEPTLPAETQRIMDTIWNELRRLVFSTTMLFDALTESLVDLMPSPTEPVDVHPDEKPLLHLPSSHPARLRPHRSAPNPITQSPVMGYDDARLELGRQEPSDDDHAFPPRAWRTDKASNIPEPYLRLIQVALLTYGHLYFVVHVFGSDTLTAYKRVFYSSVDLLGRDARASVSFLLHVDPRWVDADADAVADANANSLLAESSESANEVSRGADLSGRGRSPSKGNLSRTTFYLDVAEQLCPALPDALVEEVMLPLAQPFLQSSSLSAHAFESAHSFVLAVVASRKRVCKDLAFYYVPLLLEVRPFPHSCPPHHAPTHHLGYIVRCAHVHRSPVRFPPTCSLGTHNAAPSLCPWNRTVTIWPCMALYDPQLFPTSLSVEQFQLAFGVLMDTISSQDDAEAWWILVQLQEAVDRARAQLGLPCHDSPGSSGSSGPVPAQPVASQEPSEVGSAPRRGKGKEKENEVDRAPNRGNGTSPSPSHSHTLQILQVTYAAQLANTNLVLVRRVLSTVQGWILECRPGAPCGRGEQPGEQEERHAALCRAVWAALGRMDASGQEEGFHWWTTHRAAFGLPLTKL